MLNHVETPPTAKEAIEKAIPLALDLLDASEFEFSYLHEPRHKTWEGNIYHKPAHHFYLGKVDTSKGIPHNKVFTLFLDYTPGGSRWYINTRCQDRILPGFWLRGHTQSGAQLLSTPEAIAAAIVEALTNAAS